MSICTYKTRNIDLLGDYQIRRQPPLIHRIFCVRWLRPSVSLVYFFLVSISLVKNQFMLNWTSNLSIWDKPNRVLFLSHHLWSSGLLHRRISTMILVIDITVIIWTILRIRTRRSMGFRRMMDVCSFSQGECYCPVLEFLVRNYSIDGLLLHMMHVCIISQGWSRFEHTQILHQKEPWPGDIKRLMDSPFSGSRYCMYLLDYIGSLYPGLQEFRRYSFCLLDVHFFKPLWVWLVWWKRRMNYGQEKEICKRLCDKATWRYGFIGFKTKEFQCHG